jgi:hypothetical protein
MTLLCWNCRGLGLPQTVHEFINLVRARNPGLVFLSETRRSAQRAMQLKWRLGLNHPFGVDSRGQSGGLVLFWHGDMEVVLLGSSSRFIDAHVKDRDSNQWSRITFVYGEPRVENRHLMWETPWRICAVSDLPWLVVGDFNEAMWGFEHF